MPRNGCFPCLLSCVLICFSLKYLWVQVLCTSHSFCKYNDNIWMWIFCFRALLTRCISSIQPLFNIIGLDMVSRLQSIFHYFPWMVCFTVSVWYYCSELYHHSPWRINSASQFSYSSFNDGAYQYPWPETFFFIFFILTYLVKFASIFYLKCSVIVFKLKLCGCKAFTKVSWKVLQALPVTGAWPCKKAPVCC